ncbi:50S ribosomal protein L18 [Bacteriovoracaceae bacterium]|nr:50S ribosomal protein L18 [Bacteriovoracaceae bacterium]|tara:strand:+ start:7932 stop:8306 length:375 start_codon:yes stop_codon:yes gene_type:complete
MRKPLGKVKSESAVRKLRRRLSARQKITGTESRPRISVFRSNKHIRVQVINDDTSKTLFSVQTYGKNAVAAKSNVEGAKVVGAKIAEELKGKKISNAVFDRSGYRYHGVVATLAESIRENGIQV